MDFLAKSNLAPCFWGPSDQGEFLEKVRDLLGPFADVGAFAGDNLIAFGRNLSFLSDEKFIEAFRKYIHPTNYVGFGVMWRLYMFSWCAKSSLIRSGDFVECGVSTGSSSAIMCTYLNFSKVDKRLFLYDSWGLDDRVASLPYGFTSSTLAEVRSRFAEFPNVKLIPGYLPESFADEAPEKVAFLHVDLNNAQAEIAVLDHLFDRVSPGGIILFDDYGANGFLKSKEAEDEWMERRGYTIGELPTGQGIVIK